MQTGRRHHPKLRGLAGRAAWRFTLTLLLGLVCVQAHAVYRNLEGYVTQATTFYDSTTEGRVQMHLRSNGQWVGYATVSFVTAPAGTLVPLPTATARRMFTLANTPGRYVQFLNAWCSNVNPDRCYAHDATVVDVSALAAMRVSIPGLAEGSLRRIQLFSDVARFGYLEITRIDGQIRRVDFLRNPFQYPMTDLDMDATLGILVHAWTGIQPSLTLDNLVAPPGGAYFVMGAGSRVTAQRQ